MSDISNIIGLVSVNDKLVLEINSAPGAAPGIPAPIGSIAMFDNGGVGEEYVKIGTLDTDWDRVSTLSTGNVLQGAYMRLPIYSVDATGYQLDDVITQNGFGIDIKIATQASRSAAIEYVIPNPGDAITSADFVLTQGVQTIYGLKTFMDGMVINGSLTFVNTTNLEVTDHLIRVNKGGTPSTAAGAGFEVEANTPASVTLTTNAGSIFTTTGVGTAQNGKTVQIIDTTTGGLTATDNGSAVVIDLGGAGPATAAAVNALITSMVMSGADISAAEGPTALTGATTGITAYWKTSANSEGWDSKVPANAYDLTLNQNNLSAARVQKYADTSGTFAMRPDGTPFAAKQIVYGQDANNIVSEAGFEYDPGTNVLTAPNITISTLGAGVVHSSAAGVLSSSAVVLTSEVSGILPIANGGTNSGTALNNGRLMYSNGGAIVEYAAMQPNQVYFGAATTGLPAQSVNLFWDIVNSRLGIGTNVPSRTLDVLGTSLFQGAIRYADVGFAKANWEVKQGGVQTTTVTPGTAATIAIPTDSTVLVTANIVGRDAATGNSATYIRTAKIKNVGGTVTMSTLQSDYTSEDIKAWDGTLVVSSTNVLVRVTGAAATTIDWAVTYFVQVLS